MITPSFTITNIMHLVRFIISLGLVAVATAQETTEGPDSLQSSFEPGEIETTITMPGPSGTGTVWDCFVEGEGESSLEQFEMECTSIGNVTCKHSDSMKFHIYFQLKNFNRPLLIDRFTKLCPTTTPNDCSRGTHGTQIWCQSSSRSA